MKNTFIVGCLFLICFLDTANSFSQDYKTSIGLRGGWTSGITAKHFISDGRAIEGIFSSGWRRWHGYQITGLYEIHKPGFVKDGAEGFYWFYGGGAHFAGGYIYEKWYNQPGQGYLNGHTEIYHYSALGIDGIFGLEYKIADLPITLGVDVKPFFEIATVRGAPFGFWDSAFTIRYVFNGTSDNSKSPKVNHK